MNLPPRPVPDADTAAFWEGAARRELLVPRCRECGSWIWQPRPLCPRCRAPDPEWVRVDGAARVASWTVVHPPVLPVWADRVPFVVLLVELDGAPGVRMVGQLVDGEGALVHSDDGVDFGARVALRWRTDEAGLLLPAWARA